MLGYLASMRIRMPLLDRHRSWRIFATMKMKEAAWTDSKATLGLVF
jgi:hypothetical protein